MVAAAAAVAAADAEAAVMVADPRNGLSKEVVGRAGRLAFLEVLLAPEQPALDAAFGSQPQARV